MDAATALGPARVRPRHRNVHEGNRDERAERRRRPRAARVRAARAEHELAPRARASPRASRAVAARARHGVSSAAGNARVTTSA